MKIKFPYFQLNRLTTDTDRGEEHKRELLICHKFFVTPSIRSLNIAQLNTVKLRDTGIGRVMNSEDLFVSIDDLAGAGRETVASRDVLLEKQRHLHTWFAEVQAERLSA